MKNSYIKHITRCTIISFIIISGLMKFGYSQVPNYLWSNSAGGNSDDYGYDVATDNSGNVIVIGYFQSPTITFGTITLTNTDSTGNTRDIFVVKYDASGNALWAKSTGGSSYDYAEGVATDSNGNILITGYFLGSTIAFGATILTNTDSTGNTYDIFVVKYDASGNVLWAKSTGGSSHDFAHSVSTDSNGNILITGNFQSPTITFGATTLTNVNFEEMFIVKYDALGNVLWAKSANGTSSDLGQDIFTDAIGNTYIIGNFLGTTITFGTTTLTNIDNTGFTYDIFVVKYDALGNVLWVKSAGGSSSDSGQGISVDAVGNTYVTGYFWSPTITFGTTTLTNTTSSGNTDVFVVKYDSSGSVLWAKSAGKYSNDYGQDISIDANSNVLVTGSFISHTITFGITTLTNNDNTGISDDIFVVKYDSSGSVLWVRSAGGSSYDVAHSVSTDAMGNTLVAGNFRSSTITFGTTTLINDDNTENTNDIFVVKLTNTVTDIKENDSFNTITIFPNPSNGQFTIQFVDSLILHNVTNIEVLNIYGEGIMKSAILNKPLSFTINIEDYPKGIYFISITSNHEIITKKLIIQ